MPFVQEQRQFDPSQGSPTRLRRIGEPFGRVADLLYPPICTLCAIPLRSNSETPIDIHLCSRCQSDLMAAAERCCRKCARPIPQEVPQDEHDCANCRDKRFRFDRTIALGVYGGILREAILQMKQADGEAITIAMGQVLADRLAREITNRPDYLVSVPTHWSRRLGRNVNCPEVLAESVADRLGFAKSPKLIRCSRRTSKQGTLVPEERRRNVRGAYRVSTGYAITGANVLLVDDVMTTGATANEIAKILRRASAASVKVAVIARGIGFDG